MSAYFSLVFAHRSVFKQMATITDKVEENKTVETCRPPCPLAVVSAAILRYFPIYVVLAEDRLGRQYYGMTIWEAKGLWCAHMRT